MDKEFNSYIGLSTLQCKGHFQILYETRPGSSSPIARPREEEGEHRFTVRDLT